MPQMSPSWWLMIFIMTTTTMSMMLSILYHNKINKNTNKIKLNIKLPKWSW